MAQESVSMSNSKELLLYDQNQILFMNGALVSEKWHLSHKLNIIVMNCIRVRYGLDPDK